MRKNVAGQKVSRVLVSKLDGSPVTSGTTTVYVTVDGGTQATTGAATHKGNGEWEYSPSQAETNGNHVKFVFSNPSAVTRGKEVWPVAFDPTDPVRIGLTALPNATAGASGGLPTGDANARVAIQVGTGAGQINSASGRVPADVTHFGGSAGTFASGRPEANTTHWGGTAVASANVRSNVVQVAGQTASAAAGVTFPSTISSLTTAQVNSEVDTALADYDGPTNAEMTARTLASADYATASALATVDGIVDSILADTGTDGVVVASGSKSGYSLSAAGLDAIAIEAGLNARQLLCLAGAAMAGVLSGAGTNTIEIKGAGVETLRITATVDANGNRSVVVLNLPA